MSTDNRVYLLYRYWFNKDYRMTRAYENVKEYPEAFVCSYSMRFSSRNYYNVLSKKYKDKGMYSYDGTTDFHSVNRVEVNSKVFYEVGYYNGKESKMGLLDGKGETIMKVHNAPYTFDVITDYCLLCCRDYNAKNLYFSNLEGDELSDLRIECITKDDITGFAKYQQMISAGYIGVKIHHNRKWFIIDLHTGEEAEEYKDMEFDVIEGRGSFVKLVDSNGTEWRFEDGVMRIVEPPTLVFSKGIDD